MNKERIHAERDLTNPIKTFYGRVKCHRRNEQDVFYLYTADDKKYDLPREMRGKGKVTYMREYTNREVIITGRHIIKPVGEYSYDKILLVSIREI
jgi:hypothetical protein